MEKKVFNLSRLSEAYIGRGAINELGRLAALKMTGRRAALVYDKRLPENTVGTAARSLEEAGFAVYPYAFEASESGKDLDAVGRIYGFLYDSGLTRRDCLCALGGGVTGDAAGFAAATYLRGIGLVLIPTTIVSQTDSAYGGKTGVDFRSGKNHVGCFYPADIILTDPLLLASLPESERVSGMGEIIKYGAIAAPSLLGTVSRELPSEEVIAKCVGIKKSFVEADENDTGERRVLNFGHTFGHAIEERTGYSVPHGQAVAYGMLAAARLGERLSVTDTAVFSAIKEACERTGLDTDHAAFVKDALPLLSRDKKSDGSRVTFVLLKSLGEPLLARLDIKDIPSIL